MENGQGVAPSTIIILKNILKFDTLSRDFARYSMEGDLGQPNRRSCPKRRIALPAQSLPDGRGSEMHRGHLPSRDRQGAIAAEIYITGTPSQSRLGTDGRNLGYSCL